MRSAGFRLGDSHTFIYRLPFHSPPQDAPYLVLGMLWHPTPVRDPRLRALVTAVWRLSELELVRAEVAEKL